MEEHQWTVQDYLYVVAECLTGVLSMVGNALVLLAIARTRALQTITNCFIASLAAADILVGMVLPPTVILPYRHMPHNFHGCVLINTVVVLITNISILNLLAVALERYLAISDPFRYTRVMSVRRALLVVAVTWVVAIVLGLVPTLGWNLGDEGFQSCSFTAVIDMAYMVYLIFFGVTLPPLVFMLAIYLYIFHIVRKQQRAVVAQLSAFNQDAQRVARKQRREVRGAKGLAYVIVLFAACWLPIHIMNSVTLFAPERKASQTLHLVAIVLSHANSFINPFLYAFSSSQFKRAMLRMLFCGRCRRCYPADPDDVSFAHRPLAAARKPSTANDDAFDPAHFANSVSNVSLYPQGSGVLNRAFSDEDAKRKSLEEGQLGESHYPSQPGSRGSVRQSEAVKETATVCGNGQIKYSAEDCTAARPVFVVSAGDPSPAPPAQNGPSSQLRMTQLSMPPGRPHSPKVSTRLSVPDSEHPQHCQAVSKERQSPPEQEESPADPPHSPLLLSNSEEVEVIRNEHSEDEKVERLNSASVTAQFVSIRL